MSREAMIKEIEILEDFLIKRNILNPYPVVSLSDQTDDELIDYKHALTVMKRVYVIG